MAGGGPLSELGDLMFVEEVQQQSTHIREQVEQLTA